MLALPLLLAVIEVNAFKQYAHFATFIFFYCLFIVPLKDIEDEKGDVEHGAQSWSAAFGSRKLVKTSLSLIILLAVIFCVLQHTAQGINNLLFMAGTTAMTQLIFLTFRINLNKLYKTLIIQNIIAGLLFVSWVNFF
jgi:4-hydroxybenzoate polyprenyltransferase